MRTFDKPLRVASCCLQDDDDAVIVVIALFSPVCLHAFCRRLPLPPFHEAR